MSNLKKIGPGVSEKKTFKGVDTRMDGRMTDDMLSMKTYIVGTH